MQYVNSMTNSILNSCSKKQVALFIFVFFIFVKVQIKSQETTLYFSHFTNKNGLSQNSVHCIAQDSTGYVWLGTEDGLNRFDGYEFAHFHEDGTKAGNLSSDYITDLAFDNSNRLWIATWNGLNRYQQETETFHAYLHRPNETGSLVSNTVYQVFVDTENYIWAGTDKGVSRSKKPLNNTKSDSLGFVLYTANSTQNRLIDNLIKAIGEDQDKNVWIASSMGLNKVNTKSGKTASFLLPDTKKGNEIYTIAIVDKKIWVATRMGLYLFDTTLGKFHSYTGTAFFKENKARNQIVSLLPDDKDGLYIGTKNIGLIYYNIAQNSYKQYYKQNDRPNSIQNRQISDMLIDKSGNLFLVGLNGLDIAQIETYPFGLNSCQRTKDKKLLSPTVLSAYCQNKNFIWLGFQQQGLALYNRKTHQFKNFSFEKLNNGRQISVKVICPVDTKNLLLGTSENGLLVFDTQTEQVQQYKDSFGISSNNILSVTKGKNNSYWIGTKGGGLKHFDLKTGRFKIYLPETNNKNSLGHSIVTHVFVDSKGRVWVATFGGGLNLFNEKTGKFTRYRHDIKDKNSISSNNVTHIFEDSKGILWIGTASGLNKFNPEKGSFVSYKDKDGLSNGFVYAILEDDKLNLWLSTNYGIFKFNKSTEKFTNYDVESGLQNNEFNLNAACKTPDSQMFFGGISGFNLFDPDSIKNSHFKPNIAITNFQLLYQDVKIGQKYKGKLVLSKAINCTDTIFLSYKNNQFGFEFTAFDYTKPAALKYSFRLKGFNKTWHTVKANKRYISYTSISPGVYTLQIRATNANGVWNSSIKELTIIIETPFWQTWWFILLIVLALIGIVLGIYHIRTFYLLKKKKELEKEVKERTKTIQEKNNLLINQKEELKQQAEELREITNQLKKLNSNLEQKVASRTNDLNIALEKAEDAQKLISSFLSNMSHELRTPMNAISGFSQLIADTEASNKDKQRYAEIINTNTGALLTLVENVMDVAKLHTNQYKFVNRPFYLASLCTEVYTELDNSPLKKESVDLIFLIDKLPKLKIYSDPKAFRHIIFNLLENALKYTEKGQVEFLCSCTTNNDANTVFEPTNNSTGFVLKIVVSDTGIGIKKEYQKNIFNAFHKVEENKKKLFRGTGLGLALVKNLTDKLFGKVMLESGLNQGTKVSISIPLSRKE